MGIENRVRANLKRYIERSGLSESHVGAMSGAGQANISRFLSGETTSMHLDRLEKIANYLGLDVARFFEPQELPIPSAAMHALNMVSENLDSKDLRVLAQTAQALLDQKKAPTKLN